MICKRYTRRREKYLQRNDKRKGLAKRERDLWAEGSVAAELFVSDFLHPGRLQAALHPLSLIMHHENMVHKSSNTDFTAEEILLSKWIKKKY